MFGGMILAIGHLGRRFFSFTNTQYDLLVCGKDRVFLLNKIMIPIPPRKITMLKLALSSPKKELALSMNILGY